MGKKRKAVPETPEAVLPEAFARDVRAHLAVPAGDRRKLLGDFEAALRVLTARGVPEAAALERISPAHLGGFYAHPPERWFALDEAAKIYPLSMRHGEMSVFRLSVYLKEDVVPELLQLALDFTVKRFPSFAVTLRRGFFWHYLDAAKCRYPVAEESGIPLRPLKVSENGSPAFRIACWRTRVSAEFFHGVCDESGAAVFVKTLLMEYLRLLGAEPSYTCGAADPDGLPPAEELVSCFRRRENVSGSGFGGSAARQMSGAVQDARPVRILHLEMDGEALRGAAKRRGCTVTALVLGAMFMGVRAASDAWEGVFRVQVPVNLRKFGGEKTLRNYSMFADVALRTDEVTTLEALLPSVSRQLAEGTTEEALASKIDEAVRLVRGLRFIPLAVKKPIAERLYGFLGDRVYTTTLSNAGVTELPETTVPYVDHMDFVLGGSPVSRAVCGLITCGGKAVLSITKMTPDPSFEEKLLAVLAAEGLAVRVTGSEAYDG